MASSIKNNPFGPDKHLQHFAEFIQGVNYAGGTTPHMLMTVEASRNHSMREALWRAGCYAFVYNFATAEVIWKNWQPNEWKQEELINWIGVNWEGIKFRKERKAARSPERLAICMKTYADWMETVPEKEWFLSEDLTSEQRYYMAFDDMDEHVKYMGRYIIIRWLEVARRKFDLEMEMPDLRPKDGDHPRKALALMYPEYEPELMGGNDDNTISVVNEVVEFAKEDLKNLYDIETDYYTMQSLLCEYKQSVLSGRQYPGKSVDTALKYFDVVYDYWGEEKASESEMWKVRENIFPKFVLGEKQGWKGVRNELGKVLRDYGYTWSDKLYDYVNTTDFGNPVRRNSA